MRYYPDVLIQIHAMVLVMALVMQNYICQNRVHWTKMTEITRNTQYTFCALVAMGE